MPQESRFRIFRGSDASSLEASGMMTLAAPSKADAGMMDNVQADIERGYCSKVLFATPAFSLVHLWYKSGFPLPRHSHDVDCLYFVAAGSLRIGTELLRAGDGFFVGADVPYAYTAGIDGVEVLEFRSVNAFDIKLLAGSGFWSKTAEKVRGRQADWSKETVSPSGILSQDG
jgi:hypothetical protein